MHYRSCSTGEFKRGSLQNIGEKNEAHRIFFYPVNNFCENKSKMIFSLIHPWSTQPVQLEHHACRAAAAASVLHLLYAAWGTAFLVGHLSVGSSHKTQRAICGSVFVPWAVLEMEGWVTGPKYLRCRTGAGLGGPGCTQTNLDYQVVHPLRLVKMMWVIE